MYAKLLKEGRDRMGFSMDDLMEELKRKHGVTMTKMNYSKYESDTKQPKKMDYLFLEKVFDVLHLDKSLLPHKGKNDSIEEAEAWKAKYYAALEEIAQLSRMIIQDTKGKK